MKPWLKLALILCMAVVIASVASHAMISWVGIRSAHGGYRHYGAQDLKALTILHGSSIAWDGLDWGQISAVLGSPIESWITPGSSPAEWEVEHQRSSQLNRAIIVVSPYDLNEYWLCDFRADIVSLEQTIRDLQYCGPDRQLCKRILSQYPQMFVRRLFPTVGRSDGVMVGIRAKFNELASGVAGMKEIDAPKLGTTKASEVVEKVSDWSPARMQRRLVLMRTGFQGKHWFNGTKKAALGRLLVQSEHQGPVIMVVMPVSPIYQKEFLAPQVRQEFEETLAELQHLSPQTKLIRLDRLPALEDDRLFSDLVHLNMYGQRIATAAFLTQLNNPLSRP
ncbi:MAG TPA: hypothetical protein VIF37_17235 [Methylobacter sp.]